MVDSPRGTRYTKYASGSASAAAPTTPKMAMSGDVKARETSTTPAQPAAAPGVQMQGAIPVVQAQAIGVPLQQPPVVMQQVSCAGTMHGPNCACQSTNLGTMSSQDSGEMTSLSSGNSTA